MDYSKLSDNSLRALKSGDYSQLTDDELRSLKDDSQEEVPVQAPASKTAGEALSKNLGETATDIKDIGTAVGGGLAEGIEDTGRGIVQGGTLGFSDELYGAGSASLQAAKDMDTSKWLENYRAAQKSSEAANDASKERSPWLYGAGELAGGVGAGLATAGAGLAAAGTKIGLREAAKQGGGALTKELGKVALAGGTAGAIQGVGVSKGNIDTEEGVEKLKADASGGAVLGAGLGTAMAGTGAVLGPRLSKLAGKVKDKATKFAEESPIFTQMGKSYKKGTAGEIIDRSTKSERFQSEKFNTGLKDEASGILSADEMLGKEQGELLISATKKGVKVNGPNAEDAVESSFLAQDLIDAVPGTEKIADDVAQFYRGELTPDAAFELRKQVIALAKKPNLPFDMQAPLNKLQATIKSSINDAVPEYAEAAGMTRQFREAVIDPLTGRGVSTTEGGYFSKLKPEQREDKVISSLKQIIEQTRNPGQAGKESKDKLALVMQNLRELEAKTPGTMERLGLGSVEELDKRLIDKADDSAIVRQILGHDPQSSGATSIRGAITVGGATTGTGKLMGAANKAGQYQLGSKLANISKAIYSAPEKPLYGIANTLKNSGFGPLGEALEKALNEKNTYLKNAALFSILQNPKARVFVSGEDVGTPEVPEEEQ